MYSNWRRVFEFFIYYILYFIGLLRSWLNVKPKKVKKIEIKEMSPYKEYLNICYTFDGNRYSLFINFNQSHKLEKSLERYSENKVSNILSVEITLDIGKKDITNLFEEYEGINNDFHSEISKPDITCKDFIQLKYPQYHNIESIYFLLNTENGLFSENVEFPKIADVYIHELPTFFQKLF